MTDIDLVPGDYRRAILLRGKLRSTAIVVALALCVTAVAWGALHMVHGRIDSQITELQARQEITNQQREALADLGQHRAALQRKLELLSGLRGGAEAVKMFVTVDRAMESGDVWFRDWEFQRAGSTVENRPEVTSNGYFIVIPAEDGKDSNQAWKIETHMTVRGQAVDHSALSGFVRRLYREPAIQEVRILDTTRRRGDSVVDFRLAVTVDSTGGEG